MNTNLIDEYMKIVTKYTDAPEVFLRANAYHIFSFICGDCFKITDLYKPKPNLWFLLSSIPGRFRRSTVAELNEYTLKKSYIEYLRKYDKNFNKNQVEKDFHKMFIEDGNIEGITDKIQESYKDNITTFSINSSEFGGIIRDMTSGYRKGADVILSKLYYGESYDQALSKRTGKPGRYIPSGIYVCMFSGMQEPEHYLTIKQSRQGLLRRIVIIYYKPEDAINKPWRAPLGGKFQAQAVFTELEDFSKKYIVPLMKKYKDFSRECEVEIDTYTQKNINNIAEKIDKDILFNPDDYNIYRQTYWEHLTKICTVNAIAKTKPNLINENGHPMLMVTKDDYDSSIKFFKEIIYHTKEMLENIDIIKKPREVETIYEKVEKKIIKSGQDGITRTNLLNSVAGLNSSKLEEIIKTLLEANKIYAEPVKTTGRSGLIYKSKIKSS